MKRVKFINKPLAENTTTLPICLFNNGKQKKQDPAFSRCYPNNLVWVGKNAVGGSTDFFCFNLHPTRESVRSLEIFQRTSCLSKFKFVGNKRQNSGGISKNFILFHVQMTPLNSQTARPHIRFWPVQIMDQRTNPILITFCNCWKVEN